MDSVSQAALGAAIGEVLLGKKIGNKAALLGAVIGTLPDLDILLIPLYDDLEKISIHRGYSHSLLFCFIGAFILAFIMSKIKWTREIQFVKLWIFSFLGLATHVLLDAFTSYGTQLFLPITDWRVSLDSITIVDPVYTLPLLIGLACSLYFFRNSSRRSYYTKLALAISTGYLLLTLVNKQYIKHIFKESLDKQEISFNKLLTVPVSAANVVWYGVAKSDKNLYIGKFSELTGNEIEFHSFPINDQLLEKLDPKLTDRLKWFSQDFYTVAEKDGTIRLYNMQCDMQGVRQYGDYKAPTAFYFEVTPLPEGKYKLSSGMHPRE